MSMAPRGTLGAGAGIGAVLLGIVALLWLFGGARELQRSAAGFAGLVVWLDENGIDARTFDGQGYLVRGEVGLRVLPLYDTDLAADRVPPATSEEVVAQTSEVDLDGSVVAAKVELLPTLLVLPKWRTGMRMLGAAHPDLLIPEDELARLIGSLPNLHFGGLMTYPTSEHLDNFVRETRSLLKEDGLQIERVSGGGTPCMWEAHTHPEITEHRAGIYVYGDRLTLRSGAVTLDTCALKIHATVVSRPTPDRGILDAGSKTLSSDLHGLHGYGYICEYPDAKIYALSEEHGHVDFSACTRKPDIGERVTVIPNHCCTVTSLFNEVIGARAGQVQETWQVVARSTVT